MIGERQRFLVLHRSDATMLQWVDGNNATDTKRVRFTIAVRSHNGRADGKIA